MKISYSYYCADLRKHFLHITPSLQARRQSRLCSGGSVTLLRLSTSLEAVDYTRARSNVFYWSWMKPVTQNKASPTEKRSWFSLSLAWKQWAYWSRTGGLACPLLKRDGFPCYDTSSAAKAVVDHEVLNSWTSATKSPQSSVKLAPLLECRSEYLY